MSSSPRPAPRARAATPPASSSSRFGGYALLIIDNRPLQNAAWSEFHAARKRVEKAARDLHRHEETDTAAYHSWLHGTFSVLVTELREIHEQVTTKSRQVDSVQWMAAMTGRSLKKLWREFKEREANPEAFQPEPEASAHTRSTKRESEANGYDDDSFEDDFFKDMFGDDFEERPRSSDHSRDRCAPEPPPSAEAKDLYRRLVQHLHPDRGGDWTPARERLWHEVQQAWAARDTDWLARLEIDWETANNTLSPDSSLSRLKRAIAELHAARRDTERKLRNYRQSFAWRFSLSEKKRLHLQRRVEATLCEDLYFLRRQLAHLNATIAAWEAPLPGRRRSGRH
jgi:hypothetical protein